MPSYSVEVAVFDFIPVILSAAGLLILARAIAERHRALAPLAWAAAVLVPLGGLCKASWKLIIALQHPALPWLENMLFICMAPGFVMMAFAMHHARQAWQMDTHPHFASYPAARLAIWLGLGIGGATLCLILAPGRSWFFWLLAVTTLANATLIVQAILAARFGRLGWPVSTCLGYSFIAMLAMSGLSRLPDTEMTAWIQEGVNLSAQSALAYGLWKLSQRMRGSPQ